MRMPNFLLIGAAKSGTSSLYRYLKQHPEVYMSPKKEPKFFAFEGRQPDFRGPGDRKRMRQLVTDIEGYQALFAEVSDKKAIGEASPIYLYVPEAAYRIRHHIPEAKLIAVLRNPVDKAYSAYVNMVRKGREQLSFSEVLKKEEERIRHNWAPAWHYKNQGFYHEQLKRYYELFEPEQIRVYLYEDLKEDPVGMMQSIFRFLEVDDAFIPDTSLRHNVSGFPKSRALQTFINKPNPLKRVIKPFLVEGMRRRMRVNLENRNLTKLPMPEEVCEELTAVYREDVLKLQELIGRDLSLAQELAGSSRARTGGCAGSDSPTPLCTRTSPRC